ncbi:MAG: AMIN domain-containing protein [Sulfuricurvum sp.]|nr:AMIN domain-containing protein [Sulfuricurvum sp.]
MRRILYVSMILVSAAVARENPFFSTSEDLTMPASSNRVQHQPPLTSMTYSFPDQARVLKEATFTFQNVDGSLETRKLEIDQSIDWHNPLILSQSGGQRTSSAPATRKSSHADCGFIQFIHSGNRISLITKDPMIRYFTLSDPSSIVIDFKHTGSFTPYAKTLLASPYTKVKVTNHGTFARAIITLDGNYACSVSKTDQGASIFCK